MTKWYLETNHPVALESIDYLDPRIAPIDNSQNLAFNAKLYQLCQPPISVLDFGCGGGGFVRTVLDEGNEAVGLEGSSYPKLLQLKEWMAIPDNLFTCDLTHPFVLHQGNEIPYYFDVITAWEFVEHIEEKDLPRVWKNIRHHLKDSGLFIMTTPSDITHPPKRGLDHHRTRRPWDWWQATIEASGFKRRPDYEAHFGRDWVRKGNVRNVYEKLEDD